MPEAMSYFLFLAGRGEAPYASGGEAAARKLALLFLDLGPKLDEEALAGFADFVRYAARNPCSARDKLDGYTVP